MTELKPCTNLCENQKLQKPKSFETHSCPTRKKQAKSLKLHFTKHEKPVKDLCDKKRCHPKVISEKRKRREEKETQQK